MTLLDLLLAQNVTEFNGRRGQRVTLDLFAADLANLNLGGVDLSGANLEKADFSSSDLSGANLSKATLVGADFTGSKLHRAIGIKAKLREAYLGGADLVEAELSGADLSEADLSTANLSMARLGGARLRDCTALRASFDGADLREARLSGANLTDSDFVGAKLNEADLARATLDGASLEDADLSRARLTGASLKGTRLFGANLAGADLTAADLTGALVDDETDFAGADLTDATLDPALAERLRGAPPVIGPASSGDVELHIDEPSVAVVGKHVGVIWFNAEDGEDEVIRVAVRELGGDANGGAIEVPLPAAQVVARAMMPAPEGFRAVLLVEKPGGMDLVVFDVDLQGALAAPKTARLGYTPTTLPVFVADGDGFVIFGIGRGALSAHRWSPEGLVERLRAPASTYRGFCDRLSPVLLGKGGTVAAVEHDGIGRLLTAPPSFPGRFQAASALRDDLIALAWVNKEDKGFRYQRIGVDPEPVRVEATHHVGALDMRVAEGGWWLAWMREPVADRDMPMPMAAFLPAAGELQKPFALLSGDDAEDLEDLRFVYGEGHRLAAVTLEETLILIEIGAAGGKVVARVA